jgi:hypothetical protein
MPFRPITVPNFHVIVSQQHSIIALNMKVTFCDCSNSSPFPAINVRDTQVTVQHIAVMNRDRRCRRLIEMYRDQDT